MEKQPTTQKVYKERQQAKKKRQQKIGDKFRAT